VLTRRGRLRRRPVGGPVGRPEDSGFSLIELIVAMSIFGALLVLFATTILNFTTATTRTVQTSDQGSEARDVFNLFDRQVRSASAINRPVEVGTNWYVEFRTDALPPSTCTQWVLRTATHTLATRSWITGVTPPATPSSWRTIATDVVNLTGPLSAGGQPPFTFTLATVTSPRQQLITSLRFKQGTSPATVSTSTFSAANTSTSTVTNPDVNVDGISDSQVCQEIASPRP
jgi:prepilin-type N-terminal cleavage/methylation domain-containing protein